MAEQVTLYTSDEFSKLLPFHSGKFEIYPDYLEFPFFVDVTDTQDFEVVDARREIDLFIAGDSISLHPYDIAASGLYDLPSKFIII